MFLTIPSMVGKEPAKVNLRQLGIVRERHMPAPVVRFATEDDLCRVADEVARLEPELREEVDFVKYEELERRARLSQCPLVAVKGDRCRA